MTQPNQPDVSSQILIKLGEMGEKLAAIGEQLKAIPDHELRIRALETSKSKIIGAAIAVSVVISAGGTWVGLLITRR